ncbi:MAG: HAD family hydrolase [Candidatus Lokiarchaeota archaeon]|nr:HAD family hydrolase [Candidatus Lokiarchaeota archaeon]
MIKAITFDLWNTLFQNISYTKTRKALIEKFLKGNGSKISYAQLQKVFDKNFNFLNPGLKGEQFKHIYTQTRIKNIFDELRFEIKIEASKEIKNVFESLMLDNPPALRKGVLETLKTLSLDYRIGMISDTGITPGRIIREVLKDYNILDFFEVTVFSDETGFYKPHPIAFKTALDHLDCSPRDAIHVGDLLDTDIKGAINYEMQTVWIRAPQTRNPGDIIPDYEISEIPEILEIMKKLIHKGSNS